MKTLYIHLLRHTLILLYVLMLGSNTIAQNGSFDTRFLVKSFDCPNNQIVIQVQVKSPDFDHAFLMGDANFRFDYDPRIINNPQIITQDNFSNQEPALDDNYAAQNLIGSSVNATLGTVSLNIVYSGSQNDAFLVADEWTDVASIGFDIVNTVACMDIVWHDNTLFPVTGMNEVVLKSGGQYDQFPVVANGFFGDLTVCLPQLCNSIVASDDINAALKNTAVLGSLAVNDNTTDGTKIYNLLSATTNGQLSLNANGQYSYTPNNGFIGYDVATYRVCNGVGQCDTARLMVVVTDLPVVGVNHKPIALIDVAVTYKDEPIVGGVLNNDFDPDADLLAVSETLVREPTNGILYLDTDGAFAYIPNLGFMGRDTAIYRVCDSGTPALCQEAMIVIIVGEDKNADAANPPVANDDAYMTFTETAVNGYLTLNDFKDLNNDLIPINRTPVVQPSHGSVVIDEDGNFTYTPSVGYYGTDQFRYSICNDGTPNLCDTATVYLTIYPEPNEKPVVTVIPQTTLQNTALNFCLTITDLNLRDTHVATPCNAQNGIALVSINSSPRQLCVAYTPNTAFVGRDTVCVSVCDNGFPSKCDTARIPIVVTTNNKVPMAMNDINVTLSGTVTTGNVLVNDSDPDNQTLAITATPVTLPAHGNITLNVNGTYIYTPQNDFIGTDAISYRVCDNGSPALCDTAHLLIEVRSVVNNGQQKPVINDDNLTTYSNTPITINVAANDFESSFESLTNATLVGSSVGGVAVVNPNGTITFTPTLGFVGDASFQYKICQSSTPLSIGALWAVCDTARVTIAVLAAPDAGTNKAPIAVEDAFKALKNTVLQGNIASNDIELDNGQALTYSIISPTSIGSFALNNNGTFNFTPANDFIGTTYFTYKVCDNGSSAQCDTAVGHIVVMNPPCVSLDIKVMLEGAYIGSLGTMRTTLNRRGLLPGQTPIGGFAEATPAGQPYKDAPWSYNGTESMTNYPSTVVDWVLVSLRTDAVSASSTIFRTAALLHEDGRVQILASCIPLASNNPLYVVIEHRNHLGIMSPTAINMVGNTISIDFTATNSFTKNDPPTAGQKQIGNKWLMFAGDGSKNTNTTNFDINFSDAQLWKSKSGLFDRYRNSDFNLDADLNFQDQILWKNNNGKYSGVPH